MPGALENTGTLTKLPCIFPVARRRNDSRARIVLEMPERGSEWQILRLTAENQGNQTFPRRHHFDLWTERLSYWRSSFGIRRCPMLHVFPFGTKIDLRLSGIRGIAKK